jgi:hypothetical protein
MTSANWMGLSPMKLEALALDPWRRPTSLKRIDLRRTQRRFAMDWATPKRSLPRVRCGGLHWLLSGLLPRFIHRDPR